jgi:fucose permease
VWREIVKSVQNSARRPTGLLVTINACMFVFGVVLLLMGSLLPTLKLSGARAGSLGSFPLIGILLATVVIGPILDKLGAKIALAVALVLIAAALAVIPSLASYSALAAAALVYGLGAGVVNAATNTLVSTLNESGRGAALNLLGFSFSLGALAVPLLMSLTRGRFSPAVVLYVLCAATLLVLLFVLMQRFPVPAQPNTPLSQLLKVLRHPLVWLFAALLFLESGNENCMFVWAGKATQDLLHTSAQQAEMALLGLSAAIGAGRLTAAGILRWLGSRNMVLLSCAITFAGALIVIATRSFPGVIGGFFVIGFGLSAIFPTALGIAGDHFPQETGTVFGAVIAVALVGGAAGPIIGSWAAAFHPAMVLAVPLVAATGIAALVWIVAKWKVKPVRTTPVSAVHD